MSFAELTDDMDDMIMSSLNDGQATYQGTLGELPVSGIEIFIDRNLQRVGPDGLFRSDAVGITWKKRSLAHAARGGVFQQCATRYCVEDIIEDDGHIVTAACMVAT